MKALTPPFRWKRKLLIFKIIIKSARWIRRNRGVKKIKGKEKKHTRKNQGTSWGRGRGAVGITKKYLCERKKTYLGGSIWGEK